MRRLIGIPVGRELQAFNKAFKAPNDTFSIGMSFRASSAALSSASRKSP
jgi:hypothetical protein